MLIYDRLGQVVYKAVWDLVAPKESKEALGRVDLKGLKELREYREFKVA